MFSGILELNTSEHKDTTLLNIRKGFPYFNFIPFTSFENTS